MKAIIFMKEHSERIKGKNYRILHDKPLFYWIINKLLNTVSILEIIVDTDSKLISDLIHKYFKGCVKVLERPAAICGDSVTGNCLIKNLLTRIDGEHFIQTHSTNPLLSSSAIHNAVIEYRKFMGLRTLVGVTEHYAPFYRKGGEPINHNPRVIEQTQKLEPVYQDNSCMYIFSRQQFELYGRVGFNPIFYKINKLEAIDIDTEEDWRLAEAVMLSQN